MSDRAGHRYPGRCPGLMSLTPSGSMILAKNRRKKSSDTATPGTPTGPTGCDSAARRWGRNDAPGSRTPLGCGLLRRSLTQGCAALALGYRIRPLWGRKQTGNHLKKAGRSPKGEGTKLRLRRIEQCLFDRLDPGSSLRVVRAETRAELPVGPAHLAPGGFFDDEFRPAGSRLDVGPLVGAKFAQEN